MTSSVRVGMAAQEKAKKAAQREAENAVEKGNQSKNDQQQHKQAAVGGVSAKTGSGDSTPAVREAAPEKKAATKAPAKKAGRSRAKVQQDS